MPSHITPTSESVEEEGEDTESGFTFDIQKTSQRALKNVQKSENKQQGIKEARRDELLDGMEFYLIKDLFDSREEKKAGKENAEDLFFKSLAVDLKGMHLYEILNKKNEMAK